MRTAICIPCDLNYLIALNRLLPSLTKYDVDVVVISNDIQDTDLTGDPIIHRPGDTYDKLGPTGRFPVVVWYSFESFILGYDKVIWMGADQLLVGDISEAFKHDFNISAVKENIRIRPRGFCAGMLMIEPDKFPGIWDQWMAIAASFTNNKMGDQGVLNKWIRDNHIEVNVLDDTWDVTKRSFVHEKEWWNENKHKFKSIHYVGAMKPWLGGEPGYEALDKFYLNGGEIPNA